MKQQKSTSSPANAVPGLLIAFAIGIILTSCKKDPPGETFANDEIPQSAKLVQGKVLRGKITAESNESEIVISYNDGSSYIIIEKLAGYKYPQIDNIASAELVLSDHGLILKNTNENTVYVLTNNDPESIEAFTAAGSVFKGDVQRSLIYGTTVVRG
jgi:hypothetical protein